MNMIAMNQPVNQPLTMSSLEIADLLGSRHDHVKRSIERLAEKGVIGQPPMGDHVYIDAQGKHRNLSVYKLEKRDSYVVVAQLSPEFTARLVDRWQELEDEVAKPVALSGKQLMAAALLEADAVMNQQAQQIEDMREDVQAHQLLTNASGAYTLTEAAKNLGVKRTELIDFMCYKKWIYKTHPNAPWLGMQGKCNSGMLIHIQTQQFVNDHVKTRTQVRVTPKGLSQLAKLTEKSSEFNRVRAA